NDLLGAARVAGVVDDDREPILCEAFRNRRADAARRTRDDRNPGLRAHDDLLFPFLICPPGKILCGLDLDLWDGRDPATLPGTGPCDRGGARGDGARGVRALAALKCWSPERRCHTSIHARSRTRPVGSIDGPPSLACWNRYLGCFLRFRGP